MAFSSGNWSSSSGSSSSNQAQHRHGGAALNAAQDEHLIVSKYFDRGAFIYLNKYLLYYRWPLDCVHLLKMWIAALKSSRTIQFYSTMEVEIE